MSISFSASTYPFKVVIDVNNHTKKPTHTIRSLPSTSSPSLQSSSLPVKTDHDLKSLPEPRNSCISSSPIACYSQENTVGIIGGVSVLSTLIFLEKLVLWSSKDKHGTIPFIVCSDPTLSVMSFKTNNDSISSGLDHVDVGIVENLRRKRVFLEEAGARCIVMPCHVSHAWYGQISVGCKQPFLHIAECVAMELREARFRPLEAGCAAKIGVIATEDTLMAGFYQEKLQDQGFEVVLPDKSTMEHIIIPAISSVRQKDMKGARNLLRIAIQVLLVKAVNIVILASHDLQCLLPHDDPLIKKCIDPTDALARSAVKWAKSRKNYTREI